VEDAEALDVYLRKKADKETAEARPGGKGHAGQNKKEKKKISNFGPLAAQV
jgi:hypothetical protein